MALRQMDAVIGNRDHPQYLGEEFDLRRIIAINFLHQVFLCFALIGCLFFFGLFELFHQVTPAITMHPGFVPVLAKFSGNVGSVEFEAGVHKEAQKTAAHNAKNKQHGCYPVLHGAKIAAQLFLTNAGSHIFDQLFDAMNSTKEPCLRQGFVVKLSVAY